MNNGFNTIYTNLDSHNWQTMDFATTSQRLLAAGLKILQQSQPQKLMTGHFFLFQKKNEFQSHRLCKKTKLMEWCMQSRPNATCNWTGISKNIKRLRIGRCRMNKRRKRRSNTVKVGHYKTKDDDAGWIVPAQKEKKTKVYMRCERFV